MCDGGQASPANRRAKRTQEKFALRCHPHPALGSGCSFTTFLPAGAAARVPGEVPDPRPPAPAPRLPASGRARTRRAPGSSWPCSEPGGSLSFPFPFFYFFFFFSFSFFNNFQLSLRRAQTVFETSCFHLISYLCLFAAFYSLYRY